MAIPIKNIGTSLGHASGHGKDARGTNSSPGGTGSVWNRSGEFISPGAGEFISPDGGVKPPLPQTESVPTARTPSNRLAFAV
jgi:hypothetical protein